MKKSKLISNRLAIKCRLIEIEVFSKENRDRGVGSSFTNYDLHFRDFAFFLRKQKLISCKKTSIFFFYPQRFFLLFIHQQSKIFLSSHLNDMQNANQKISPLVCRYVLFFLPKFHSSLSLNIFLSSEVSSNIFFVYVSTILLS